MSLLRRLGVKHHEFWPPRFFEAPYYLYLGFLCLINRIGIRGLAKANYALDHGEIGLGSKYATQLAFDQSRFLPTTLLKNELDETQKREQILEFAAEHGYPLILKSDVGCVGKGIRKLKSEAELDEVLPLLLGDYILQKFTPFNHECGIFYVRHGGVGRITGINTKHFPAVTGNGRDSVQALAEAHPRFTHHWQSFLQDQDVERVPDEGEEVPLSFIGSHTLGCMFTDDTHVLTPALNRAILALFEQQPGFNFGRVDVKAESEAALQQGEFVVIEVNGVASLPTHMFDPGFSLFQSWRIFLQHATYLVQAAKDQRGQAMELLPYREIWARVKHNQSLLNKAHAQLKEGE